ncbi:MAG: DUF6260 family protein [Paracoccaceae bacterium]|nr:DUF6260 family protein [Paracoccaceae bacterium]
MLYFDPAFATNTRSGEAHREQAAHVASRRAHFASHNAQFLGANGLFRAANASAIIPQDVYREFESQTKELMRAPNLTLLGDLMPLAKGLPVGKVEHVYRKASDSGVVVTDLEGSSPVELDKADYIYDSTIKVVHRAGFGRSWMEMEGQRSEGFDGLVDDQANSVRKMQEMIASHIYNGADVTFKGTAAVGIKNSSRVASVDLDASGLNIDFTSSAATAANIRSAWISLVDTLKITNNVGQNITFYVSREIMSNFQRYFSTSDVGFGTILQSLLNLNAVAAIKEDAQLSGNEVIGLVLDAQFIRPLVGMAVTTVPLTRSNPFDNYNFITWANVGLEIKTDYSGRTGVLYAREIA